MSTKRNRKPSSPSSTLKPNLKKTKEDITMTEPEQGEGHGAVQQTPILKPGHINSTTLLSAEIERKLMTEIQSTMNLTERDRVLCCTLIKLFAIMTEDMLKNAKPKPEPQESESNKAKIKELESRVEFLEYQQAESDMYSKRNNLIFSGVPTKVGDTKGSLTQWFRTLVDAVETKSDEIPWPEEDCDLGPTILAIHRTGPRRPGKPRDVIVQFQHLDTKKAFYRLRFDIGKLKGYENLYIKGHYPALIRDQRKVLQAVASEARNQFPNLAKEKKISVHDNVLYMGHQRFKANNLDDLPLCLKPVVEGYRQTDSCTIFFTNRSKLSNHYPSKFKVTNHEGKSEDFNCGEQFFMVTKARLFEDEETVKKIMATSNPAAQKGLGKTIKGLDEEKWYQAAPTLLLAGLKARFEQNDECREALMATGDRKLGEATKESPWGIGFTLTDKEALNPEKWHDKNLMGLILESIRNRLK